MRTYPITQRPDYCLLNTASPLARGLMFGGFGLMGCAGSKQYFDSSVIRGHGALNGYTGAGNTPPARWSNDLGRRTLSFDGANDYMQAPLPSAFTAASNPFSVSWWSKALASQSLNCIVSVQYGSADAGKLVNVYYYTTFGGIIFTRDDNANSTAPTTAITQQAWHHFCYTYSGSGTYGTIYVDGVAVPTSTSASTSAIGTYGLSLGIGQGGGYKANMVACDLMLHNYPLPASCVAQIANPSNVLLEVGGTPLLLPAWHRSAASRTGGIPLPLFQGAV